MRGADPGAAVQAWQDSQDDPAAQSALMAYWPHPMDAALCYTPTVDEDEVPSQIVPALQQGKYNQNVPILSGTNKNEAVIFIYAGLKDWVPMEVYESAINGVWPSHYDEIMQQYPPEDPDYDGRVPFCLVLTDYLFECSQMQFTMATASRNQKTWVYRYDHVFSGSWIFPKFGMPARCGNCTCHAAELPFVFHNDVHCPALNVSFTPDEVVLATSIVDYWTSFAHTGDPNAGGKQPFAWPPFDTAKRSTLIIEEQLSVSSEDPRCSFWDRIGYDAVTKQRNAQTPNVARFFAGWE